ncbi:MAG: glycosyltransferase [Cetobacterium sp.]
MKKILIYNGQLFMGGIERVLISYLQGISKDKDLDITLLIKENNPAKNVFYKDIPENVKCEFIKSEKLVEMRENISKKRGNIFYRAMYQIVVAYERLEMKRWLKEYFKNNSYDSVIDFDMSLGKYLDEVPYEKIGWCHYSLAAKKGKKRERFRERLEKYDKIVVICDEMKEELNEVYPTVKDRGVRIYNPMDIDEIIKKSEAEKISGSYMVAVSRLVPGKGRLDLIDIYLDLKKRGIKEKLYILGEGSERIELQKRIDENGLQDEVLLLGQKENPYPWMKNSKMFLHPSYGEGLPTVLIEAMICKSIVVAYDCPTGPKEILGDGKFGALIPLGDKKKFADSVYEILENENLRDEFLSQMKTRVNEFSVHNIKEEFKNLVGEKTT